MLQTGSQAARSSFVPRVFGFARGTIVGTVVDALTQNQATEVASSTRFVFCSMLFDHWMTTRNLLWDGCLTQQKKVPPNPKCNVFVYNCWICSVFRKASVYTWFIIISQPKCPEWEMGHTPFLRQNPKPSFLMLTSSKNLGSISPSCGVSFRSTFLGKPNGQVLENRAMGSRSTHVPSKGYWLCYLPKSIQINPN